MFKLDERQWDEINEWDKEHQKGCPLCVGVNLEDFQNPQGAIGGRLTYKFTPTSLGMIQTVECACKNVDYMIDVSYYDSW